MNKLIFLICSVCSLHALAESPDITSVATWKAVAIKDSTRSKSSVDIGTLGAASLTSDGASSRHLSSGDQKIYVLPLKQDIPEYTLFTKVISNTLSNDDNTSELKVNVLYGNKSISSRGYQQILISDKQEDFSFKIVSAGSGAESFMGNVDVGFMFYWDDNKSI